MTSSYNSRLGTAPEEAIKAPVKVETNVAITLSGEQTVNSVAVVAGDRVLVKDQASSATNGIYVVSAGSWTRATDWNDSQDVVNGILILSTSSGEIYQAGVSGIFTINLTEVSFVGVLAASVIRFVDDKSTGDTLALTLPDGVNVVVKSDSTLAGVEARYVVASGLLVLDAKSEATRIAYKGGTVDEVIGPVYPSIVELKAATGYSVGDYASAWRNGVLTQFQFSITGTADEYGVLAGVGGFWTVVNSQHAASYGVVADGIVDDQPASQAAAEANIGGTTILPEGTIRLASPLLLDTTGLGDTALGTLKGQGFGKTIIDVDFAGSGVYATSGTAAEFAYGLTIEDLRITSISSVVGSIGVRLEGTRFTTLKNIEIDGMGSHGIYGLSTLGDFTDNAQMTFQNIQVESCGGYGIYAESGTTAIQYGWNMKQCRIGLNALGGVLLESVINTRIEDCGIYYNQGFGLRVGRPIGGVYSKNLILSNNEFDTNDGTQLDLGAVQNVHIDYSYLIDNTGLSTVFSKGIVVGDEVRGCQISASNPRFSGVTTGLVVHEFELGSVDVVVRDTSYNGFLSPNGDMYQIGEPSVVIDDVNNRNGFSTGSYTAELKNSSQTVTSPTTIDASYSVVGNVVTVGFRLLNNVDISGFAGGDILILTLPFQSLVGANASFTGQCIITSDAGTGIPYPSVDNGASNAAFVRSGSGAFVTAANLTTGVSDFAKFTLTYIRES